MAVITISRQLGSLGCDIADAVAQQLGYRKVWRGLINQAARKARTPQVALALLDDLGLFGLKPSRSEETAYLDAVRDLVEEYARAGDVLIVGRGGQVVLRGWAHTLHVRIIAPLEVRVARLVQRQGISAEPALAQIRTSDRARKRFIARAYSVDWDDPSLYDLVLNTAALDIPRATGLICYAATTMAGVR
jgi:CMP/dCMP kinase